MAKKIRVRSYNVYADDMAKCMSYCLANGIKIYMLGAINGEHKVQVNNNGKITTSSEAYSIIHATDKVWELYCHFYRLHK